MVSKQEQKTFIGSCMFHFMFIKKYYEHYITSGYKTPSVEIVGGCHVDFHKSNMQICKFDAILG